MKRIDIYYGDAHYSLGGRDIDEVQAEIDAGLVSDRPAWLAVNFGEGRLQEARLLITPGVSISLIGIEDPDGNES